MKYKIYRKGECVAQFMEEFDRDCCYNLLKELNKERNKENPYSKEQNETKK